MCFFRTCCGRKKKLRKQAKEDGYSDELEMGSVVSSIPLWIQITEENRREKWLSILSQGVQHDILRKSASRYEGVKNAIFGESPADCSKYPSFGCVSIATLLDNLDETKRQQVIRVLILLYELNRIAWCPMIVPTILFLQSLFSEAESYHIVNHILETPALRSWLFVEDKMEFQALLHVLEIPVNQHAMINHTINTFYLDAQPINALLPFFDCYLEGGVLFLCYLQDQAYQEAVEKATHYADQWNILRQTAHIHPSFSSYSSTSTSSTISSLKQTGKEEKDEHNEHNEQEFRYFKPIPRSRFMTKEMWSLLLPHLPKPIARHMPTLLYTSFEDGYCLDPLLRQVARKSPTLLLATLPDGVMVGIYREDEWENLRTAFGKSSTRLLRRGKEDTDFQMWEGVPSEEGKPRFVYIRSTKECILVGAGGKEGIALCISNDFLKSYSQKSQVFNSPALFNKEFFQVLNIEVFEV